MMAPDSASTKSPPRQRPAGAVLRQFINGWRFALAAAFKAECKAKRSALGLVSFPGRRDQDACANRVA